jgi:hypothetical protein
MKYVIASLGLVLLSGCSSVKGVGGSSHSGNGGNGIVGNTTVETSPKVDTKVDAKLQ